MAKQLRSLWLAGLRSSPLADCLRCFLQPPCSSPLYPRKNTAHKVCCVFSAPPGTRTLGLLIKRNQRATIVNFQNCVNLCFVSAAFFCTYYPLLHPSSSCSGVQKVCKKYVQSQNQPLKTGIGFLCKAGKMGWFGSKMASAISPV